MNGIEQARHFTAEALRALRPGGVFFVVVPDYLKERTFFWDVDYTHNFVTTERRVRQLFNDGGFEVLARRARHRSGHRRRPRRAGGRGAAREHPRRRRAVALHRHDRAAVQDPQEPVRDAHLRRPEAREPIDGARAAGRLVVDARSRSRPRFWRGWRRASTWAAAARAVVSVSPRTWRWCSLLVARRPRGDDLAVDAAATRPRRRRSPRDAARCS